MKEKTRKMASDDGTKGVLLPIFSGKQEDYKVWAFKFESYASMKEFMPIMKGEVVSPPTAQAEKSLKQQKAWKMNAVGYANLLSGMTSMGVGFSIAADARTAELTE